MRNMITMGEFIVKKQADYPIMTGELTSLLSSIRLTPPRWRNRDQQGGSGGHHRLHRPKT